MWRDKKRIRKKTLVFKVKTSDQNKIFGSISSKQIILELGKMGYDIDKKYYFRKSNI